MVRSVGTARPMVAEWLGRIGYREAWARQKALLERRAAGEIDDRIFKYVGVAGVDKARIVQVGVPAESLCK